MERMAIRPTEIPKNGTSGMKVPQPTE